MEKGGKALIFCAPSGAGKTTIVRHLMTRDLNLHFSVSVCSRLPRANEVNGVDYHFIHPDQFKDWISAGLLLEWEEVYPNLFYGTTREEVDRAFRSGKNLIFDVDVKGGLNLKKALGNNALSIFIHPGSVEVLESRLKNRSTDSEEQIEKRLAKAAEELSFAPRFDKIIFNHRLEDSLPEVEHLAFDFLFPHS